MSVLKNRKSPALTSRMKESAASSRTFPPVSGRASSHRNLLLFVLAAGTLMALLLGGADMGRPAQAAATPQNPPPSPTPDYSNVDDILNGRRYLLRTDDLAVLTATTGPKILQTADSAITKELDFPNIQPAKGSFLPLTGRMFAFSADVVVTPADNLSFGIYSPNANNTIYEKIPTNINQDKAVVHAVKMADFNLDGYDDLVINYGNADINAIQIANAKDVKAFAPGLAWQGENIHTVNISTDAMAIGDFNGDGRPEIIGVIPQGDGNGLRLVYHTVDEKTLHISDGVLYSLTIPEGAAIVPFITAAAGKFTTTNHDQLLIAYAINGGTAKVKLIDFAPSPFQPQELSSWDTGDELRNDLYHDHYWTGLLRLQVGRFNWSAQYDQALLLHGSNKRLVGGTDSYEFWLSALAINLVDFSIKEQGKLYLGNNYGKVYGLVLGNFDRRDPDPQKDRNPNLQAAVLSTDWRGSTGFVNIYDIDPLTLAPKQATSYQFSTPPSMSMGIAAGDLQGRSMRLGEPTKVVIHGTAQPSVVAAAPPMHVAYVAAVGETKRQVLNLSAIPKNFSTSYETDEKSSNQSSTTHTTSWSFGAKESIGGSLEVGSVKKGDGIKFSDTISAAQALKGSTETTHGTYSTHSFDISQETGFADQLWYSQTRFNIYVYPVIGQTVCPATKPNCQESEKVPLTIQFSGPDQTSYETVAASQVEWYQPTWEYGNVLSYPGSYAQLQQLVPDIDKVSTDLTWATDASILTVKTTWATDTSHSQSTSLAQNYSFENDFSVSGAAQYFYGAVTGGFSFDIDLSGSFGFSDLNKSTTKLGKSQGIGVHKPGSFLDPANYSYFVTPYIFGRKQPGGSVDNALLTGDVQTFGLLQTAFTVDPTRDEAGGWWKQAYTIAPDVALSHPNRWQVDPEPMSNPLPGNCRPLAEGNMNCAKLSSSLPNDPWLSDFHDMRGFFISNATHPGQGPQLQTAKAGDKLSLRARVHNYSLAHMDGAKVHVRFYGMEWNNTNLTPKGASFLIGEDVLPPILPFNSDPRGAPLNWVLAETTFDTTPYADKYLVFWVVVWAQKDGKLTSELPGHGLTAIPADLKDLADASRIEEQYSNNVGFYKLPFYVFKPSVGAPLLAASNGPDDVRLGRVNVSNQRIAVGQSVEVSALLRMGARSASGVTAVFYDGDPQQGGKAFDVERIPHLRAGDTHEVKVRFKPRACGEHRVFVSVGLGTPFETTSASAPVEVVCNQQPLATPVCSTLCQRAPRYYLNNLNRLPNGTVLVAGGGLNATIGTGNTARMRLALDGGNSTQERFNQQFVTTQLSLLAAPGQDQAALQSPLSCYRLDFAPVRLGGGAVLGPNSTLGELFEQARRAARQGSAADLEALAHILSLLNGDDPLGRCGPAPARRFPEQTVQQLDALIDRYLREKNLPSVVVGVWVPGEGQYLTARGQANLDTGRLRALDDPFRIASITKSFTALAVLQLVDQGLLSKSDKLSKWFPDFPKADLITVDDLLRMRSGIADSLNQELWEFYYANPLVYFPAEESIRRAAGKAAQFELPNQKTVYTNVNYNILEVIVERVTGRSLGAQITESILKPLGLSRTLYPTDSHLPGDLRGYSLNPRTGQFEDKTLVNPSLPGGAGAMISTLEDLRVYVRALCTGALLSPETHKAMLMGQPQEGAQEWVRYGEGVALIGKFCGHNGTTFGFSNEMFYLPEKDAVIVINVNRLDIDDRSQSSGLFLAITKLLFPGYVNW